MKKTLFVVTTLIITAYTIPAASCPFAGKTDRNANTVAKSVKKETKATSSGQTNAEGQKTGG